MRARYGVKQLSIFLENRKGRLREVTQVLAEARVNIRALALAESAEFGILRLVVDNPEKARTVLSSSGFTVKEQDVFAVEVPDQPGGFFRVVEALAEADINVDYTYAFVRGKDQAILIFKVPDDLFERALEVLSAAGLSLVEPVFFYSS